MNTSTAFDSPAINQAALAYAERGWPVFPCKPNKSPFTKHGHKDASTAREQIKEWWSRFPSAMIGIPTGSTSGFFIIDLDRKEDRDGLAIWSEICQRVNMPPLETLTETSPTGGKHLLFKMPPFPVKSRNNTFPGVDVKADGGYVVFSPSVCHAGAYVCDNPGHPIADPPEELIALLKEKGLISTVTTPYGQRALDSECRKISLTGQGGRNDQLNKSSFKIAQLVAGGEVNEADAQAELERAALDAGLDLREVQTTIKSGMDHGLEYPRKRQENEKASLDTSLDILPPPPPVPLEAFPESIQNLIVEAADAYGAPQQIPTACLLSLLSCFVGRTRAIEAKPGWYEHGNTWIIVVGPSGVGKTPISDAFYKALNGLEYRMFQKWKAESQEYTQALFDFNKTKKKDRGTPPVIPGRTQYYVDDTTLEAVAEALEQNPRGILWRTDELAGMLADFDKYSKSGKTGSTRARLLSSYDCQPWKSNRRDISRNTLIPAACVSIFGGIQPGMMPRVFDGADEDSGFLPRFLFIRAEQEKPALWSERTLSTESMDLLKQITERLAAFKLKVSDTEGYRPYRVELSEGAKAAYVEWHNALAMEGWTALNEKKSNSINQKFKGHALRLCLLLHCLDAALADKDGLSFIQEDTMRRALLLADWAREHQAQVWKMFSGENAARSGSPLERAIMSSVVADEEQIRADNGRIANKRLVELVNSFLPCPVDSRIIGKAATSLGLAPCYIGSTRARHVPLEKIDVYKTNVGNVGNVGSPTGIRADEYRHEKNSCRSCR